MKKINSSISFLLFRHFMRFHLYYLTKMLGSITIFLISCHFAILDIWIRNPAKSYAVEKFFWTVKIVYCKNNHIATIRLSNAFQLGYMPDEKFENLLHLTEDTGNKIFGTSIDEILGIQLDMTSLQNVITEFTTFCI